MPKPSRGHTISGFYEKSTNRQSRQPEVSFSPGFFYSNRPEKTDRFPKGQAQNHPGVGIFRVSSRETFLKHPGM